MHFRVFITPPVLFLQAKKKGQTACGLPLLTLKLRCFSRFCRFGWAGTRLGCGIARTRVVLICARAWAAYVGPSFPLWVGPFKGLIHDTPISAPLTRGSVKAFEIQFKRQQRF